MLKRIGAVFALAGCSGTLAGAPSNPAVPPAVERRTDAALTYAGTLQESRASGVSATYAMTARVTAASNGAKNPVVTYKGQSVQTGKGGPLTTTFDADVAEVPSSIRQGDDVTRLELVASNTNGVVSTTTYDKGNGVFDELPAVKGARWNDSAARRVSENDSSAGSSLVDRYAADGSYDETAVPVEGRTATMQSYPDGNAVYQWPLEGAYLNSSIAYTPPKAGKLRVVFTDAEQHQTYLIELHSWYPANPLALASDATQNAGTVRIPKACRVSPHYGGTATELDESVTRVDIVFGEYETTARTAYVGGAGLLCLRVHDVLETHYDYEAFAFSQKPLTTIVTDEVLGLRQASGSSGAVAAAAAAIPLDANIALAGAASHLSDAAAIYTSLQRAHGR